MDFVTKATLAFAQGNLNDAVPANSDIQDDARVIISRLEWAMRKVVISGPPPVQVLDVTGPLEVFSNVPDYCVAVVTSDGSDQLLTSRGLSGPRS